MAINWLSVAIGGSLVCYGVYTSSARTKTPEKFAKLEPLKKVLGKKAGTAAHIIGYTVVPIIAGILFIIVGLNGESLF